VNSAIFRKVALERLSSPERLDQPIRVTKAGEWIALIGLMVLLGAAVVWSFKGSLATKVLAQGIIIRREGVVNIVGTGTGLITKLNVKTGDTVQANQIIAEVSEPSLLEKIKVTEAALQDLKEERQRVLKVKTDSAKLQLEALERQKSNAEREIENLREQIRIVDEQIPVDDQLLARGLITKQQSLANRQKKVQLEGQVNAQQAIITQVEAQRFTTEDQPRENDIDMQGRVTDLERNLASLRKDLSTAANVVSPYSGQVLEVKVYRGSAVSEGTPIISIQPDSDQLEALIYLSSLQAKDAKPGMEVQLSPGTVRREEFGYMTGRISFVASYPATQAAMMSVLGNETLMQSISSGGPVTEVRARLDRANTPSGFRWSSREGPPIQISSGTLCTAQIVTKNSRPISLALPVFKEKLALN